MQRNKKQSLLEQVRRFRARFAHSVASTLGDVIPGESLLTGIVQEIGTYRERIYGPLTTLVLFIEQVLGTDHSCQDTVARGLSMRVALGQSTCSLNTGPYCKARARLPTSLLSRLACEVARRLCTQQPAAWRWRGHEVKLIDGTTVSMPDTKANQAQFPQHRSQRPGLGFPVARLVAVISLSCGVVLDWALAACEGKHTGEMALFRRLMPRLSRGDVVIADGYYCGYFLIAHLIALGVEVLLPQHHLRRTDFRRGQRLGVRDHIVTWARPLRPDWMDAQTYETMPAMLTLREARAAGRTFVTTFLDAGAVAKQELADLYAMRWQVELDLRSIKSVMQMDILRCKTPAMVEKEIAAHLLAYNLVRAVMAQAAFHYQLLPRQLSFKAALQLLNAFEMSLRHQPGDDLLGPRAHLLRAVAQRRLLHRPGRVEPRAVKRRAKPHDLLTRPRHIERRRLLKLRARRVAASLR
jgi:hypothetical protein